MKAFYDSPFPWLFMVIRIRLCIPWCSVETVIILMCNSKRLVGFHDYVGTYSLSTGNNMFFLLAGYVKFYPLCEHFSKSSGGGH